MVAGAGVGLAGLLLVVGPLAAGSPLISVGALAAVCAIAFAAARPLTMLYLSIGAVTLDTFT